MENNAEKNVIRAYRLRKKLSCAQLAKIFGIAESTLRSYENGSRPITPSRAREWEVLTNGGMTRRQLLPEFFEEVGFVRESKRAKRSAAVGA